MDNIIGPALPPHMQKKGTGSGEPVADEKSSRPSVSATRGVSPIGPTLPPWLADKSVVAENDQSFGPSLPPKLVTNPCQPKEDTYSRDEEDDDPIIGPQPVVGGGNMATLADDIEERSKRMKNRLLGLEQPKKLEREEWMTELPPLLQGFGGGPRKFRTHERNIGDRSVWTDTPADKARKRRGETSDSKTDQDRVAMEAQSRRDKEICDMLSKDNKRNESLMSMHEKERKRKAEAAEASGEAKLRRPFDRDLDLQANKFDDAAKKRIIKQSQDLSSRFSSASTTAKFL